MKIFSNLAISLDGRIAEAASPSKALGTPLDRKTMQVIRAQSDVIVVGASTLRAHPRCYKIDPKALPLSKRKKLRQPANAVISASGILDPDWAFWQDPQVVRFVFTTSRGYKAAMAAAKERAFVIDATDLTSLVDNGGQNSKVDLNRVVARLKESGLNNVLVEGGGELIAEFLAANLLQMMYVTLTPWALGGKHNPSLLGGQTQNPWKKLKLMQSKRVKDEIYLQYKVQGARSV